MEKEKETLHNILKDAVNIEDLDFELPVAITNQGYFRVTQTCYLKVYVELKNYKIANIYLTKLPNTYACKVYLHENFIFDSATVPWYARWAVPEVGRHSVGAAFHDLLYRSAGYLTLHDIALQNDFMNMTLGQSFADKVFNVLNVRMKVREWRQFILYKGVRIGGHFTFDSYLKRCQQKDISVGDYVVGGGFAVSNMEGCSKVTQLVGNIAFLENGDKQLIHSLKVAYKSDTD